MTPQPDWQANLIELLKSKQSGLRPDPWPDHRPFTLDDLAVQIRTMLAYDPDADFRSMASSLTPELREQCEVRTASLRRDAGRILAIINAMTMEERKSPAILSKSRRDRIARGSGAEPEAVEGLIRYFDGMRAYYNRIANQGSLNWLIDHRWDRVADNRASGGETP